MYPPLVPVCGSGAEVVEASERAIVAGVEVVLLLAQELDTELEGVPVLGPGEVVSIEEGVEGVVGSTLELPRVVPPPLLKSLDPLEAWML